LDAPEAEVGERLKQSIGEQRNIIFPQFLIKNYRLGEPTLVCVN